MKTNVPFKLLSLLIPVFIIFLAVSLSNCKGHVEIFGVTDSIENCSAPYIVYFYADAEHRTKDLEYTWDFGDGTESHDQEPMHKYTDYGIYKVTLSIKQNKSFDSKSISLYLTEDSTSAYSDFDYASYSDSLWAPANVEFQNYSKHATSFLWEFGDGDTSTVKNPTHIYQSQGTYTCLLNAMCHGDTSKFSRPIVIKAPPHKIDILDVTIWMPDTYLGTDVWVNLYYAGNNEGGSSTANSVSSFPITFNMSHTLFAFNGIYDSSLLEFELWSSANDGNPEKIFYISSQELQNLYYPTTIGLDDGYGFKYEAKLGYRQ
ncbi:MAG: PKD domain-containing protein [Chlorobi bacterium]|nr:PKD domain-containing protein [Chlorobiota bacterium]